MNVSNNSPPALSISAEMDGRRFVVRFDGMPVALPYARYRATLTLVDARLSRDSGLASIGDFDVADCKRLLFQTMKRLRNDLTASLGELVGKSLIETCGSCTYVLRIEPSRIEIDPNLIELAPVHLPLELVERLIENSA